MKKKKEEIDVNAHARKEHLFFTVQPKYAITLFNDKFYI